MIYFEDYYSLYTAVASLESPDLLLSSIGIAQHQHTNNTLTSYYINHTLNQHR